MSERIRLVLAMAAMAVLITATVAAPAVMASHNWNGWDRVEDANGWGWWSPWWWAPVE